MNRKVHCVQTSRQPSPAVCSDSSVVSLGLKVQRPRTGQPTLDLSIGVLSLPFSVRLSGLPTPRVLWQAVQLARSGSHFWFYPSPQSNFELKSQVLSCLGSESGDPPACLSLTGLGTRLPGAYLLLPDLELVFCSLQRGCAHWYRLLPWASPAISASAFAQQKLGHWGRRSPAKVGSTYASSDAHASHVPLASFEVGPIHSTVTRADFGSGTGLRSNSASLV